MSDLGKAVIAIVIVFALARLMGWVRAKAKRAFEKHEANAMAVSRNGQPKWEQIAPLDECFEEDDW